MTTRISAIVVVSERFDDTSSLYRKYSDALKDTGKSFEFLYVLDGNFPDVRAALEQLREAGEQLQVLELGKSYGEATALNVGLRQSVGDVILTLPAYDQVDLSNLGQLLERLPDADVAIAVRWPRRDASWNRLQAGLFHRILTFISGTRYRDLGCGVRAYKRSVFNEIPVYGDLHRFVPLLAARAGFAVEEVELPQSIGDIKRRVYNPGIYLRRLLDMLTVFFLVKFTKKPLRFFGLLGVGTAGLGSVALLWILIERIFFSVGLSDRPILLLSTLSFAVGVQLIAVGLIGELIIFTHARELKEYSIDRIAEGSQRRTDDEVGAVTTGAA